MRHAGSLVLTCLIGIVALAALWAGILGWIRVDRATAERNLAAELNGLANRAEERADTILRGVDRGLVLMRKNWRARRLDLAAQIEEMMVADHGNLVLEIAITDASGVIVYANRDGQPAAADVGDRPFFRHLQESGADRLFTSGRMTDYIVPGTTVVAARPLLDDAERPNGAVMAWLDPDRLFQGLKLNGYDIGGQLILVGNDGRLRACSLPANGGVSPCEEDFSGQPFMTMAPGSSGPLHLEAGAGMVSGRTGVFRTLRNLPLTLVVLRDDAGVEAMFSRRHRPIQIIGAATSFAIVAGLLILALAVTRSHRRIAAAEEREQQWRAVLGSVGKGTWEWTRATDRIELSDNVRSFLGLPPASVGDILHLLDLIHPDDWKRIHAEEEDLLSGESDRIQIEHRVRRGDGTYTWVLARGVVAQRGPGGRIERTIGVVTDVAERRSMETALTKATEEARRATAKLAELAVTDVLTSFWNRRGFMERAASPAAGAGKPAVMALDLDGLKGINDRFGYEAGDAVLRTAARRIQRVLRTDGVAGRIGGDSFAVLLSNNDEAALATAEALRAALASPAIPLPDGGEASITASIGVAVAGAVPADLHTLLERADLAMRQAKETGRDRVVLYGDAAPVLPA